MTALLNGDNYLNSVLMFQDRQAGISLIYDPNNAGFTYNAYCVETKLLKELMSCEYAFLDDALNFINDEFATWQLQKFAEEKSGCGSCAAK